MSTKFTRSSTRSNAMDIDYELTAPKDTDNDVDKPSVRTRKPTEKGRLFQSNNKRLQCQTIEVKLTKLMAKLDELIVDFDNVHVVQNELELLNSLRVEFQDSHKVWRDLSTEEERARNDSWNKSEG